MNPVIERRVDLRLHLKTQRKEGKSIGFVPTMGNLHAGHLSLMKTALDQGCSVVVSIFVNPLQFGANEDFARYPRTLNEDLEKLSHYPVTVFVPNVSEIYGENFDEETRVDVSSISHILCGVSRKNHFSGVATVLAKLFNIVQPDHAFFGEKDFQQCVVVKKLVHDLMFPIHIHTVSTMREEDGLAMSSRNHYLNEAERAQASQLYATLCFGRNLIIKAKENIPTIEALCAQKLSALGFNVDYVKILTEDLTVPTNTDKVLRLLAAAYLGTTRLIDNIQVIR